MATDENGAPDPELGLKRKSPVRPNYLYLSPIDMDLRRAILAEAAHLGISQVRYVEGILLYLGVRGRADAYSEWTRTAAIQAAKSAMKRARKKPGKSMRVRLRDLEMM